MNANPSSATCSRAPRSPARRPVRRRARLLIFGLSALLGAGRSAAFAEELRPLLAQDLPNAAGKSFTAVEVDFAPGSRAEPHRHGQAFVYAYVLSGAVRSQLAGGPAQVYRAGQSWFEPPGARHLLTENVSPKVPARLLVVFVANTGEPLKTADISEATPPMPAATASASVAGPAPEQMVDALYSAFGDHHARAVHAKGVLAAGTFEPSRDAATLSSASLFAGKPLPVLVRFSDFTGIPDIPDNIGEANPRGFALKFTLPDGSSADVVSHSFNGFPTATAGEFRQLLLAIGASGAGAAKPTPLDQFLATHPIARTFLTSQKPPPVSYATLSYFGVNTFAYADGRGGKTLLRYRFVPRAGEAFVPPEELAAKGPNYLVDELPRRLASGPIVFDWYAQIAEAADAVENPSVAWPESRRLVNLGTVRIDHMAPEPAATDKATMFRPLNVPAGITSADPMLGVRQAAYPLSFKHRNAP